MAVMKLNLSLDEDVVFCLRQRASALGLPVSQYLARLVREEERRQEDLLAAEGYRLLSAGSVEFAEECLPLARETWT